MPQRANTAPGHRQRSARRTEPDQLAEMASRIEKLEREKAAAEGFAAVAAHELVEPLVMAEALVAMLHDKLERDGDTRTVAELDAIGRTTARARMTAEVLLHEARAAHTPLQTERVVLAGIVDECLWLLRPRIQLREARVVVEPLPVVRAEPVLVYGVYFNLMVNALRYGPAEGSVIRLDADRQDDFWRLSVTSNGRTIPASERARIFAPFERGTGERRLHGAGLGLVICKRIVARHGGRIGVEPSAGGNRFWFTLPAA